MSLGGGFFGGASGSVTYSPDFIVHSQPGQYLTSQGGQFNLEPPVVNWV